jgi:O-antigen ligase
MNKRLLIEDTLTNKISYYHILLFLILLPFDRFYTELVFVSFLLHTLIHLKKENLKNLPLKQIMILQSVYLVTLVTAFSTTNTTQAFSFLTRQVTIFVFPVLLFLNPIDLKKYRAHWLQAFAATCCLIILYLYVDAFRVISYHHLPFRSIFSNAFINHNFSLPIQLHATYLSLYVAVSLVYVLTLFYQPASAANRWMTWGGALVLFAGLVQLGSRSVLIAVLLIVSLLFPLIYLKGKKMIWFMATASVLALLLLVSAFKIEGLRHRFYDELKTDLSMDTSPYSITDPRIKRWEIAWNLIRQAPLAGYGSGDETDRLSEKYFENKLYNSYLFRLNAHNEYLSFLLKAGILGLLVYLYGLFYGFKKAYERRDFVFLGFMTLLLVVSVSENFLDVNKGIFFYAFFFSFFVAGQAPRMEKHKK